MKQFVLNGAVMTNRSAAHDEIARALELPEHYGRNLDALWDVLTGMHAEIVLHSPAPMLNALGIYGCKLLQTMYEAAAENEGFQFSVG